MRPESVYGLELRVQCEGVVHEGPIAKRSWEKQGLSLKLQVASVLTPAGLLARDFEALGRAQPELILFFLGLSLPLIYVIVP